MTKINLGISPCPNDTFIFGALILGKVNTDNLDIEVIFEDVQTLNEWALESRLECTKLSCHAYLHVVEKYLISSAGSALGYGCGPLLIAKSKDLSFDNPQPKIAIPGNLTTANMLLSIAYPKLVNKVEYLFSEIEQAIINDEVDAGVIIHENRFTYQQNGLTSIMDLGEYWEQKTGLPIPLGCIAIRKDLGKEIGHEMTRLIQASLAYAYQNPHEILSFVQDYAQEMDQEVIQKHIDLYVNDFSFHLGERGEEAIRRLWQEYPFGINIYSGGQIFV